VLFSIGNTHEVVESKIPSQKDLTRHHWTMYVALAGDAEAQAASAHI
jgi:hypothetical protein